MSNKAVKKKKYEEKAPAGIILSIIAAGIIPLIMHTFTYDSHLSSYEWFPSDGTVVDIFLAYKSFTIIIIGILMAIALLYRAYDHEKMPVTRLFYCLFAYAALVLISGLASRWKGFAFGGSYEMFESVIVVLCYIVFCYYTFTEVKNQITVCTLLRWVGIFSLILMGIGVFQGFGLDLFRSAFGKVLFASPSFWSDLDSLVIQMAKGTSYSTIYNPNYFSLYLSLLLPVYLMATVASDKKNDRILYGIIVICALILLITIHSSTGVLSVVLSAVVTLIVVMIRWRKRFCITIGAVAAVVVIGIVCIVAVPAVNQRFDAFISSTAAISSARIRNIETGDAVKVEYKDGSIYQVTFDFDDSGNPTDVVVLDKDGNTMPAFWNEDNTAIDVLGDDGGLIMSLFPTPTADEGTYFMNFSIDKTSFYFIRTDEGYQYITGAGKIVDIDNDIKSADIFSDTFFSNRGFIWNHTIPLLPKHIILGSGQNTFLMEYPQNDYVNKSLLYGSETTTIDVKPHNLYLQQWVQNGMIAMILYLVVVIGFLIQTAGLIKKGDIHDWKTILEIGVFCGILGHSIAGIANDSNVCTSPVMWVVLGLGFAVNAMQHKALDSAAE